MGGGKILFRYHDDRAESVSLAGDFTGWKVGKTHFRKSPGGVWTTELPCLPRGKYCYKFLVDGRRWTEDPGHGLKEEDGFGGFNSVLNVL